MLHYWTLSCKNWIQSSCKHGQMTEDACQIVCYPTSADELTIQDGVIFRGECIAVPSSLRKSMTEKVHAGHTDNNSSLRRARYLIYWPQMSTDIRHYVEACGMWATYADKQFAESLVMTETPDLPWQKVESDLFSWSGRDYGNNILPQRFLRVRQHEEQFQSTRHTANTC